MLKMIEIGINHPDYPELKEQWTVLVDTEWRRLETILNRQEQERLLSGAETETVENVERIANDLRSSND